jgi:hypothetical protein
MPLMQARCMRFDVLLSFLRLQFALNDGMTAGASQVAVSVGDNTTKSLQVEDNGMGIQVWSANYSPPKLLVQTASVVLS